MTKKPKKANEKKTSKAKARSKKAAPNRTDQKKSAKPSSKSNSKKSKLVSNEVFQDDLKLLKHYYPDAHCALNFTNAYELLVATVLSAQCTDERVNMVTPELFDKYPSAKELSQAEQSNVELLIRSTGFYTVKAKNLISAAKVLVEKHNGEVPKNLEDLILLSGVGRKTANVVLGNVYNIASGVVVDTHVSRLSQRLGWTKETTPEKIEQDLANMTDPSDWIMLSHYLISHGRKICKARSPLCTQCFLSQSCPKNGL